MRDVFHEIRWGEACCRDSRTVFGNKKKTGYLHSMEKVVKRFTKMKLQAGGGNRVVNIPSMKGRGEWLKVAGYPRRSRNCVLRTWVKKLRSFLKSKARIVVELHSYGQRTGEGRKRHARSNELHAVFPRGRFGGGDNQKV